MFSRKSIFIWIGIVALSSMFLLGQQTWPPEECIDNDGDGFGDPASSGCLFSGLDCDDSDPDVNPAAGEGPFGDPTCSDGVDNDCNGKADNANEPTCDPDDLNMTGADFECILNWNQVNLYYLTNKRGYLTEALAVANSPTGGTFPPGTIIQLLPAEAMVKRAPGWNPTTNDWEFFFLTVSSSGTVIQTRGAAQTTNPFGGNCFNCHSKAAPQWDLVCEDTHGCDPLPPIIDDAFIIAMQQADPRCP
jgi:hypothetical protein